MLVLFAGGALVLFIVAALAFDTGMILVQRRDEQNAADAAALAGARYVITSQARAIAAARDIARQNGFDDTDPTQVVDVHIPPIHGLYAGLGGFIEVDIQDTRESIFGGVIGRGTWPVSASAVATNAQNLTFPFSMMALNPTACSAIKVTGGGVVQAFANIQSNSNGTAAGCDGTGFSRTGGATIDVEAPDATCRVVGTFQDAGSGPPITCTIAQNSFALPDPLRNLAAPGQPALAAPMVYAGTGAPPTIPKNCPGGSPAPNPALPAKCVIPPTGGPSTVPWILSPGLYPGGLDVEKGRIVYLLPGIYWIGGGGLNIGTGGSIMTIATAADAKPNIADATWGGGVMFYNSRLPNAGGDSFALNSNAATMKLKPLNVALTDPNSVYNNIVIFQDRSLTTCCPITLNGAASTTEVRGIVYVPGAQVKLNGNGGTLVLDQVIADTYDINGNGGTIKVLRNTGVDSHIIAAGLVQ